MGGVACGCCLLVLLLVAGLLIYLGLGINWSGLTAWNKPRDLGVRYTQADLDKGRATTGVELAELPALSSKSIEFEGSKDISGEYSSEMITAMINGATYKYYPLTDTQVLIHPDGTLESSGNIDLNKVINWATDISGGNSVSELEEYANSSFANPSFYITGTMSVVNNDFDLNVTAAQVSFLQATPEQIAEYAPILESFVEQQVSSVPNMFIRSADFSSGELRLDATYPAIERTIK